MKMKNATISKTKFYLDPTQYIDLLPHKGCLKFGSPIVNITYSHLRREIYRMQSIHESAYEDTIIQTHT